MHVVGTNGKSSTTRMIAALLAREGLRTACFTSPHLLSYRERIQIGERDIEPERFAAAIAAVVHAGELVDRAAAPAGDVVTQFELLTAAALCEFEAAEVDVAVLEAGLGGRYDATNVVDSRVAVLTNVGLEHTRYLGPTVVDIAREKLDVVRPGATLVVGGDLDPGALAVARETVAERGARLVKADGAVDIELRAGGGYQRRNFAAAQTAAAAFLGREPSREHVAAVAAALVVRGRFEVLEGRPVTLLDGAHNDGGIEALAQSLPDVRRRPPAGRGRLDPRRQGRRGDAVAAARTLRCGGLHGLHEPAGAAGGDAGLAGRADRRRRRERRDRTPPGARARARACRRGRRRAGHRLDLSDRRSDAPGGRRRGLGAVNDDDGPSLLAMMAGVALVVALVILVFVGIGYLFGRLVL